MVGRRWAEARRRTGGNEGNPATATTAQDRPFQSAKTDEAGPSNLRPRRTVALLPIPVDQQGRSQTCPLPITNSLKESIRIHGVRVPVIVDQDGKIIDGWQRDRACKELGIYCPRESEHFATDAERLQVAITLNIPRRHWSRHQRRELIAAYLKVDPAINDNELGRHRRRVARTPSPRCVMSWRQLVKLTSCRAASRAGWKRPPCQVSPDHSQQSEGIGGGS